MVPTRNAEATQQRLVDAALSLYAERGYAGTCLDAILKRAASSKGAFYHHFGSKEELTARALSRHWDVMLGALEQAWQQSGSPEEKVDALLSLLEPECTEGQVACPIGLLGFESRSLPEPIQQALQEGLGRWSEQVAHLLMDLGIENAQARSLAEQLFLIYEGGVLVGRISGSCGSLYVMLEVWQQAVLNVTCTRGGPGT